jgi:hypothetical protein
MGTAYWRPLLDLLTGSMGPAGTIDETDVSRLVVTDSPEVSSTVTGSLPTLLFATRAGTSAIATASRLNSP